MSLLFIYENSLSEKCYLAKDILLLEHCASGCTICMNEAKVQNIMEQKFLTKVMELRQLLLAHNSGLQ